MKQNVKQDIKKVILAPTHASCFTSASLALASAKILKKNHDNNN